MKMDLNTLSEERTKARFSRSQQADFFQATTEELGTILQLYFPDEIGG